MIIIRAIGQQSRGAWAPIVFPDPWSTFALGSGGNSARAVQERALSQSRRLNPHDANM